MIYILIVTFFFLSIASLLFDRNNIFRNIIFYGFGVFLILLAAFRGPGLDRDYDNYITAFNNVDKVKLFLIEPSFYFISQFVKHCLYNNIIFLFLIYSALGVGLKILAVRNLSEFFFLSLLIYFSYSFTLHEMTQIRVGVASGFFLLSIKPLYERRLVPFLLLILLATLFHYSALILFFLWFIKPQRGEKLLFSIAIPISYLIHFFSTIDFTTLSNLIPILPIQNKILSYEPDNEGYLNVFNIWQLIRIAISLFLIWKADLITKKNKYGYLVVKIYVIATCAYVILAFNPSFAGRIGDLFAIVDIIALPLIVYTVRQKIIAKLIVVAFASTYLFLNLFYNQIIQ